MPAPGFAALFEVSTETFGLCVACIGGVGFGCRSAMNRNSGLMHLSGLGASLLTAFYCLYGLRYWFNGIQGYSCESLLTVMRSCLSLSQGLALIHLFMKSDATNCKTPSWIQYRWLGLVLTAVHWGAMASCVIFDMDLGGEGFIEGLEGLRCVSDFGSVAHRVKWMAAWCSQLFQTVAFIRPLQCHLVGTARVRLGSGKRRRNWTALIQTSLWRGVIAVACSLAVTTIIAGFSLARSFDRVPHMPVFAVEVLVNAVNLAAIYFAVQVDYPKVAPKYPPRNCGQLLAIPNKYRRGYSHSGSYGDFCHGGELARPGPGYGRRQWRGDSRFVAVSKPSRLRYVDPTSKRLPPVIDASPEVSAPNSPEVGIRGVRGRGLEGLSPIRGRIEEINTVAGGEMIIRDELAHAQANVIKTFLLASHPGEGRWLPGGVTSQLSFPRPRQSGSRPRTHTYPAFDEHRIRSSNTDGADKSPVLSVDMSSAPTTTTLSGTAFSTSTVIPEAADHSPRGLAAFNGVSSVDFHSIPTAERPVALPSLHNMMEEGQNAPDTWTWPVTPVITDPDSRASSTAVSGIPRRGRTAGTPANGRGGPTSPVGVVFEVAPPDITGSARRHTMTECSISPGSVALAGWGRSPTTLPSAQSIPGSERTRGLLVYSEVESGTGDGCDEAHEEEVEDAAPTGNDASVGSDDSTLKLSSKAEATGLMAWWGLPGQREMSSQRGQRGENVEVERSAARDVEDDFVERGDVPATTTTSFAGGFAHALATTAAAAFAALAGIGSSTPRKLKTSTPPSVRARQLSAFSPTSPSENSDCLSRFSDDQEDGETTAGGSKKRKTPSSPAAALLPSSSAVAARSRDRAGKGTWILNGNADHFSPDRDFPHTMVEPVSPLEAPAITVQSPATFLVNFRD